MKGLDRKYLRAFLQRVGSVEVGISPLDLSGTREGHLRELHQRVVDPETIERNQRIEEERYIDPIATRTRNRQK